MSASKRRFVALTSLLAQRRPDIDPSAIEAGRVLVDGRFVTNPRAQVPATASIRVITSRRLRGDVKLSHALETLDLSVTDRVAVDLGASAGGFTTALLDHGARRVYAVDVGVGQLLGGLRLDPRVVNLEGCNVADVDRVRVPDRVEVITVDLSYLPARRAIPQLRCLELAPGADLVVLVKPTFELATSTAVRTQADVQKAVSLVAGAMTSGAWEPVGRCDAPKTGRAGAPEVFLHARRR